MTDETIVLDGISDFQDRIRDWCVECFGAATLYDTTERNWRFLEEALELVQSLGGNAEDAHKLVDYVFNRPAGESNQELGGTMVTLAALAAAGGFSLSNAAGAEADRIHQPEVMNRIRAKHAAKPHKSPLPGDYKFPERESLVGGHPAPGSLVGGKANRP